jgi:hypothetical protein
LKELVGDDIFLGHFCSISFSYLTGWENPKNNEDFLNPTEVTMKNKNELGPISLLTFKS